MKIRTLALRSATSSSSNGWTSSPTTKRGSASTIRRRLRNHFQPRGFHRHRGRAHPPHQTGHRGFITALPSAADACRAHQPARPHHARAGDVRMRSGRAGVRRDDDGNRAGQTAAHDGPRRWACWFRSMRGETVTAKTDWFTLNQARLHLAPYSRPGVEIAVANQISPTGARAAGWLRASTCCRWARPRPAGFSALEARPGR